MFEEHIYIGISDLKSLLFSLKMQKGIDFSEYALSSLKRRVENFMKKFHFKDIDELTHKIIKDEYFFELFLKDILVDTTELFRDPGFWIELKRLVFFKFRKINQIKIFIPESNSGEDLFSLLIMLRNEELLDKAEITLGSLSKLNVEKIQKATIETKKMEVNIANFEKIYENDNIFNFFQEKGHVVKLKKEFLKNVTIIEQNLFSDEISGMYHLILFRNKTIYYNPQLKVKALNILKKHLITGGFITLGIKEKSDFSDYDREFETISETEKIYKKTI
jgi:chemotaxis protein methyltransferase CheR